MTEIFATIGLIVSVAGGFGIAAALTMWAADKVIRMFGVMGHLIDWIMNRKQYRKWKEEN